MTDNTEKLKALKLTIDKLEKALGRTLMTIGTAPEMVDRALGEAVRSPMSYAACLSVSYFAIDLPRIYAMTHGDLDLYITTLPFSHHVPLAWSKRFMHLPDSRHLKTALTGQMTTWLNAKVNIDGSEVELPNSRAYRVNDGELQEFCKS